MKYSAFTGLHLAFPGGTKQISLRWSYYAYPQPREYSQIPVYSALRHESQSPATPSLASFASGASASPTLTHGNRQHSKRAVLGSKRKSCGVYELLRD